jgi:hypothetical protein
MHNPLNRGHLVHKPESILAYPLTIVSRSNRKEEK